MISRIARLKYILKRKGISSIILIHPANVSYLLGFPISDSSLFINEKESLLITDARYAAEYKNLLKNSEIQIIETNKALYKTLEKIDKKNKIRNLAFEERYVSFFLFKKLKSQFGKRLIATSQLVEDMRIIKDVEELRLIKKAIAITLDSFDFTKKILKPGITELELAGEIERYIRLRGAPQASFDIIVASGPNSSFPHAKKTNKKISNNEPVLIDMGVDYKGYKSDLTRMFFLGKINTLLKKAYNTVLTAQQKAINHIKPGITIGYIDKQAREYIAKNGFKNCFKHSLGHGIGLETHELPQINQKNKKILKEAMVFTVEPGIYLDNKFGVRVEDMVLVTSKGVEVLSAT